MSDDNRALYNCIDAAVTLKVWDRIKAELNAPSPGYLECYNQTMNMYNPAIFMSLFGLKLDRERLEAESARIKNEIYIREQELNDLTSGKLNANSPKSCQQYFYGTLGIAPYTSKGRFTTDDTAMTRIARRGIREATLVQEIRRLNKLKSTYLDVRSDADGRIRASWNLRGTAEGRLSSSQNIFGTGLNFQNLHPLFKSFIVADEDFAFLEIDKAQAEWVTTAYLCGDARMLDVIERGLDPHLYTASLICGAPIELLQEEAKLLGHITDPDTLAIARREQLSELLSVAKFLPRTMTGRQAGKKGNHALNYKEGYVTFALVNEIPETESRAIVEGYRSGYCNLPLWWEATEAELRRTRILDNCFGRKRRFLDEWGPELVRRAVAFRPQSTVSDLTSRGMIATYNDKDNFMQPVRLCAHGHDSVLLQYPRRSLIDMAKAALRIHEHLDPELSYGGRSFYIKSELKVGLNWGEQTKENPNGMREITFYNDPIKLAEQLSWLSV